MFQGQDSLYNLFYKTKQYIVEKSTTIYVTDWIIIFIYWLQIFVLITPAVYSTLILFRYTCTLFLCGFVFLYVNWILSSQYIYLFWPDWTMLTVRKNVSRDCFHDLTRRNILISSILLYISYHEFS